MATEEHIQTALTFIAAMNRGDPEAADPCLADDAYTVAKSFRQFAGVRQREEMI